MSLHLVCNAGGRFSLAALSVLLLLGVPSQRAKSAEPGSKAESEGNVLITDVTVLPMTPSGSPSLTHRDVLIRYGHIVSITTAQKNQSVRNVHLLDGRGKYLMPGLSDMHVHIADPVRMQKMADGITLPVSTFTDEDALLPFIANGVTQIFNLSAGPESIRQRDEVEAGKLLGPHQATALMLDGVPPMSPPGLATLVRTPEEGVAAVERAHALGYDAIKTYSALNFDTFSAIVAEGRKLGMIVMGHIPLRAQSRTADLFQPGYSMVAHSEEYAYQRPTINPNDIPGYVALAKTRHVWLDTTIQLNERVVDRTEWPHLLRQNPNLKFVNPYVVAIWLGHDHYARASLAVQKRREEVIPFNRDLVRAFYAAGIPMVTGTDSLVAGGIAGYALHRELEALSKAGLPNAFILRASTYFPALYLGVLDDRGTVEVGKRADLLLLDANPLADMANTRKISAVILSGHVHSRQDLDERMARMAFKFSKMSKPLLSDAKHGGHLESQGK